MAAFLSLVNPISAIIDRLIPDKSAAATAKANLVQLEASGELQTLLGQIQTNTAEAANTNNKYAGDWRPTIGYILGAALGYSFVLQPFAQTLLVAFHVQFDPKNLPVLDMATLMPIVLGMLGLAGTHAWENVNASK